jgi:beta-glucanase (GH16 family)
MTGPGKFNGPDLSEEFHAYKLEWTENYIKTYIDNKLVLNF